MSLIDDFATFLKCIRIVGLCLTASLLLFGANGTANAKTIRIAYLGTANTAYENGVKQGILEANLQGEFLGITYELVPWQSNGEFVAIVIADSADAVDRIAKNQTNIPVFNIQSTSNRLRALCRSNLFHVIPSQQMFSDAQAQWRSKHPESNAQAQAWHRSFRKYAAAQLNGRYHESFATDMDDAAWAGWAATKLLADVLVRSPELLNEGLITELKTNVAFDGQKGIDMTFRETGQLAQPLLLIEDDAIKGEAPVRGVVDITDLNSLGEVFCPK